MTELGRVGVLAAVEFDTKMDLGAVEVKNVRPDRVLAAELEAGQLPRSQM